MTQQFCESHTISVAFAGKGANLKVTVCRAGLIQESFLISELTPFDHQHIHTELPIWAQDFYQTLLSKFPDVLEATFESAEGLQFQIKGR